MRQATIYRTCALSGLGLSMPRMGTQEALSLLEITKVPIFRLCILSCTHTPCVVLQWGSKLNCYIFGKLNTVNPSTHLPTHLIPHLLFPHTSHYTHLLYRSPQCLRIPALPQLQVTPLQMYSSNRAHLLLMTPHQLVIHHLRTLHSSMYYNILC